MEELKRLVFLLRHLVSMTFDTSGAALRPVEAPDMENEGADFEQVGVEMISQTLLQIIHEVASGVTSACGLGFFLCK